MRKEKKKLTYENNGHISFLKTPVFKLTLVSIVVMIALMIVAMIVLMIVVIISIMIMAMTKTIMSVAMTMTMTVDDIYPLLWYFSSPSPAIVFESIKLVRGCP